MPLGEPSIADVSGDDVPEVISTFDGDTLLRREADTDRDGRRETTITFRNGKKAVQEEDRDGDGNADARYTFGSDERVLFKTEPFSGQRLEPIEEVIVDVDEEYIKRQSFKFWEAPHLRRRDGSVTNW